MPRVSERSQALQAIETAIEVTAWVSALASSSSEEDELEEDLEDLLTASEVIKSTLYQSRGESAGRHRDHASLDGYIYECPDDVFCRLFRMNRASFWQLVELLTNAGGADYWKQVPRARGEGAENVSEPIYQQIAAGLHVLGRGGQTTMNIGHGTMWKYAWRTITLLARLVGEYVRWPARGARRYGNHDVFRRCIGFLDGSDIVLQDKPMIDPEAYLSRRKNYGFNLQAICDWNGKFIWVYMGQTANVHDSTAFKSSSLYRNSNSFFDPEEYVLADKAYALERHIIAPYKKPASQEARNATFNEQHAIPRAKIEHAFGVLKERWPSLSHIPVQIGQDQELGHRRVINWTMACIVLHNILHNINENQDSLENEGEQELNEPKPENEGNDNPREVRYAEIQQAGIRRRDELRDLIAELHV